MVKVKILIVSVICCDFELNIHSYNSVVNSFILPTHSTVFFFYFKYLCRGAGEWFFRGCLKMYYVLLVESSAKRVVLILGHRPVFALLLFIRVNNLAHAMLIKLTQYNVHVMLFSNQFIYTDYSLSRQLRSLEELSLLLHKNFIHWITERLELLSLIH